MNNSISKQDLDFKIMTEEERKNTVLNHMNLSLTEKELLELLEGIKSEKYKKDILENSKRIFPYSSNKDILAVYISSIDDDEFKKSILLNSKKYGFMDYQLVIIAMSLSDEEYLKYSTDNADIVEGFFLRSIITLIRVRSDIKKDVVLKLLNRENNNLDIEDVIKLIDSLSDNLKKDIMINLEKCNLDSKYIPIVFKTIKDDEFKKKYVKETGKRWFTPYVISTISDDVYKKNCIKTMDFSLEEKIIVSSNIKDDKYKKNLLSDQILMKKIDLPNNMTFGIEIESEGINSMILYDEEVLEGWLFEGERTTENGVEVPSPVLKANNKSIRSIYYVCSLLNVMGQTISERCGGHVHIGADYLNLDFYSYKNLVEIFLSCENILYLISNEKGTIPREEVLEWAPPISKDLEKVIEKNNSDNYDYVEKFKEIQGFSKTVGLNLLNIGNRGKNTIEFRISNGTINPDTWIENVNLFGGIVRVSRELAEIQKKDYSLLSKEETKKIILFDKLKDFNTTEEEKLIFLLDLVINSNEKNTYIERYTNNKELWISKEESIKRTREK